MNLTQLQLELREIEERISSLHYEIEKMKPQTEDEKKKNFEKMTKLAKQYPLESNQIQSIPIVERKKIINALSYLILLDESEVYSRLLYLLRLSFGVGLEFDGEEIYKNGLEFQIEDFESLEIEQCKYVFMLEAFTIANLAKDGATNMLRVIADLLKLLNFDTEELRVVAMISKARLQDDFDILNSLSHSFKNNWGEILRDYIDNDWLVGQRKLCRSLCLSRGVNECCEIHWSLENARMVKKGEKILTYTEYNLPYFGVLFNSMWRSDPHFKTKGEILSPCDGMVFFKKYQKKNSQETENYYDVYVVSCLDNYDEFSKWHEKIKL